MVSKEKLYHKTLLQELLWPNRWQCTVACLLLNVTTRKQVDKVWPTLFQEAPGPQELLDLPIERLIEIIKPLGLYNRRAQRLRQLATAWEKVPFEKLPGVGKYAAQSDKIFFSDNLLWDETVEDGALVGYLDWRRKQNWKHLT
jgi:endonuclease III